MTIYQLKEMVNDRFKQQYPVKTLWQTLSEHFYAERADFTTTRNVGQELADTLLNSYPLLVRRDLGNSIGAMLRDGDWFKMTVEGREPDQLGQMWLDWATTQQRRAMYNIDANFVRATKEGDHDYAAFGQCVISVKPNLRRNSLLYQCWHLRDCAWWDDETGQVGGMIRKWQPSIFDLSRIYGADNLHRTVRDKLPTKPFDTVDCTHIVMPAEMYDEELARNPRNKFVSIHLDMAHEHIMAERPMRYMEYVVPRFQTIAGSPYAYSPATVVALPDARCLQAMTHTLMEAAERYARPPLVGTLDVVRGDVDLGPDGITWVDKKYDERLGAALQPLKQDRGGFPIGYEMQQGVMEIMADAFYLNKINLPEVTREMTAYEVAERMKQFRRENLPLFAPIEAEYNGALCERTFDVAWNMGLFGSPQDIPESLQGADVQFKFESPLSQDEEREKAERFRQTSQLLAEAAQIDPGVRHNMNFDVAYRDAVTGLGAPAGWLNSAEAVQQLRAQDAQAAQMAQAAEMASAVNA